MTARIPTKYAPLPGVRSLNFWICVLTAWYPAVFSASVLLYWNCHLTDECHMASRHAGTTDVSPAKPLSDLYNHSVLATMEETGAEVEFGADSLKQLRRCDQYASGEM